MQEVLNYLKKEGYKTVINGQIAYIEENGRIKTDVLECSVFEEDDLSILNEDVIFKKNIEKNVLLVFLNSNSRPLKIQMDNLLKMEQDLDALLGFYFA